jgi:hypothetical protein
VHRRVAPGSKAKFHFLDFEVDKIASMDGPTRF